MPFTRRLRRTRAAAVALLLAGGLVAATPSVAANAAPAAPKCPKGGFAFNSSLTNGTFAIGKSARTTGASATACGEITTSAAGDLVSVVKKKNVKFEPTTTKLGLFSLPTTITPTSNLTGPTVLNADGSLETSLRSKSLVTTTVLGAQCSFTLDLTLTTGRSGSLKGTPLVAGPDGLLRGKFVANDFSVPAFQPTASCPLLVALPSNLLIGLPLKPGASSATFDVALSLG